MSYRSLQVCFVLMLILIENSGSAQRPSPVLFQQIREKNLEASLESLGEIQDAGIFWSRDRADAIPAAIGGIARLLSQEREEDQYELLHKWTMPTPTRNTVRVLTSPVPHDAPPEIFARVLRERPRKTSFEVSSMNGIRGLYSTGWKLVSLAEELGRLDRLTTELEELNQQKVPDADVLLLLAKMVHRQVDASNLQTELLRVVDRINQTSPAGLLPEQVLHPSLLALGAATLHHEQLMPLGESILKTLKEKSNRLPAYRIRAFMHAAHAVGVQRIFGSSKAEYLYENQLKYWVPTSLNIAYTSAEGATSGMWITHEDHILHLTGGYNDVLFFRYPLAGEFEFASEVQATSGLTTHGSLGYGGLFFQSLGRNRQLTVWDADMSVIEEKPCPFAKEKTTTSFDRATIRSTSTASEYTINRHPMWFDREETSASPFVGFRYYGNHRSLVRNLQLTGNPIIPREVDLSSGTQLRGWQSRFYGESKQSAHPNQSPNRLYDWYSDSGELRARHDENTTRRQSLLRYQRPLLEEELIRYEYFYVPGKTEVHPSLGRLAFLIEPGGVRIHWITDGAFEWTGLAEDNATLEPLNRRGPRPLPLKEQEWNTVELSRKDRKLTLTLNGETIYERPLDYAGDTNFGLFRDPSRSEVRVRNVLLSGDWPEQVPDEFLANPTAVIDEAAQIKNRLSSHSLAGPEYLAVNVNSVRRRAASLPIVERYKYLVDWVLPSALHADIRMNGEFTQTDPSPLSLELEAYRFGDHEGAELVSPLFDLLDTAAELGRLKELSQRIESLPEFSDLQQQRAKRSIQIMLDLELGRSEETLKLVDELQQLLHESFKVKINEFWPEIHLIGRAMHRHAAHDVIAGLVSDMFQQRHSLRMPRIWQNHVQYLTREYQADLHELDDPRTNKNAGLQRWFPVTKTIAEYRGQGSPQTRWTFTNDGILTIGSGQCEDYLFYQSPLAGEYEVQGEISEYGISYILTQGTFIGPRGDEKRIVRGTYRTGGRDLDVPYPVLRHDKTVAYRANVTESGTTVRINGHQVAEYSTPDFPDPWVGLRSLSNSSTAFHNVQIGGTPTIPDEVVMTTANDLGSWLPYYLGTRERTWNRIEDGSGQGIIHGSKNPELAGSHFESLLRYHRPLWEDGSIEYKFFYTPDKVTAHPALDRLVFLLDPDGVRLHWLTDGSYDETSVSPDNVVDEPENRRGPGQLPLNLNEWNRLKLEIAGAKVSLELNGQLIYERELESTNHRTFGLFHYADRTELLAGNLVMRGDWPKELPPVFEQELTESSLAVADRNLEKLTVGFHHDFTTDGLPLQYFTFNGANPSERHIAEPGGIRATMNDATGWKAVGMIPRFSLHGDFDVQAKIDELDFQAAGTEGAALLDLKLNDEQKYYLRSMRSWRGDLGHQICGVISPLHPTGKRTYRTDREVDTTGSGTLRISRVGKRILFMFAPEDSSIFRVFRDETITDAEVMMHGIQLKTSLRDGKHSSVLWKNVTVRAEGMKYLPPQDEAQRRELTIMNADGTNVRKLIGLLPGMTNLGSPEFSSDGKQIALDMSQGSVSSSRIVLVNTDGSDVRDLGPGCMPSISPDGKKIAFTQSGKGIVLMDFDGSNHEVIEPNGWGVQYSPDGQHLAIGMSENIVLMNLKTRNKRELFTDEAARRYAYTFWNLGWSHDSKSIAFQGQLRKNGDTEIVVVDIDNPNQIDVIYPNSTGISPDFTFSPDNRSVLFSKNNPEYPGPQLFLVHRDSPGELELLKGQPLDRRILSCAWSHDGKTIAFPSLIDPEPVEWTRRIENE